MTRRSFLRGAGAIAGLGALGGIAYGLDDLLSGSGGDAGGRRGTTTSLGGGHSHTTTSAASTSTTTTVPPGEMPALPTAAWVREENARPGSLGWTHVGTSFQGQLEGFTNTTSAALGDEVTLYVSTVSSSFHVEIYRMGWYGGKGARVVATTPSAAGVRQADPVITPGTNMVECHWAPSLTFQVEKDWAPGNYLLRLVDSDGAAEWVPLTIRDDSSTAAIVIQNSVTSWQAYNHYGGYSLYGSVTGSGGNSLANRSRIVSFDRPYYNTWAAGAADWLGNEFPLVMLAERHGLDVAYWTDIDLHSHPERLAAHRCVVSLGHDEYWSSTMRDGAQSALGRGVNWAFLGANACYRHVRFEASPTGADRRMVCYKVGTEDPLFGTNNAEVTANWPSGPDPRPESELIGAQYQCYGGSGAMVVVDPTAFAFKGTGLAAGAALPGVIGSEFDSYVPAIPGPRDVQVLCHSPTGSVCGQGWSDMTWYTVPGGGGVFASGTASFIGKLSDNPGDLPSYVLAAVPGVTAPLTQMTLNVLAVLGEGPGSRSFPSQTNWQRFYSPTAGGLSGSEF